MDPDLVVAAPRDALEDTGDDLARAQIPGAEPRPQSCQVETIAWAQHRSLCCSGGKPSVLYKNAFALVYNSGFI